MRMPDEAARANLVDGRPVIRAALTGRRHQTDRHAMSRATE
jgi:hypothetical protein